MPVNVMASAYAIPPVAEGLDHGAKVAEAHVGQRARQQAFVYFFGAHCLKLAKPSQPDKPAHALSPASEERQERWPTVTARAVRRDGCSSFRVADSSGTA